MELLNYSYLGTQFSRATRILQRFVQDFARIVSSLTQLTKKGVPFVWSDACDTMFQDLKQWLVPTPVPESLKGYVIYSDVFKNGLGCVLMQHGKVVVYVFR